MDSKMHLAETFRTGMIRSLTTFYPDTRREHHPAAPHVCALPPRQRPRRPPRPSPRRPRTRFLPRATRPHSPNPHFRRWTTPASLPIARRPRFQSLQCECHCIHALVFPPNLFLECARRFPAGCLLAAGLRFELCLFRSCLLLCQLLLGSYPLLSQPVLNRHLDRRQLLTRSSLRFRLLLLGLLSFYYGSHTRSVPPVAAGSRFRRKNGSGWSPLP